VEIASSVGFEVLVAVAKKSSVFWNITPYSPVKSAGLQDVISCKTELLMTPFILVVMKAVNELCK
jgi:hypothetical protein